MAIFTPYFSHFIGEKSTALRKSHRIIGLESVCELLLPEGTKIFSLEDFLETGASFDKLM